MQVLCIYMSGQKRIHSAAWRLRWSFIVKMINSFRLQTIFAKLQLRYLNMLMLQLEKKLFIKILIGNWEIIEI